MSVPTGYTRLPDGVACKCPHCWREADGSKWCCLEAKKTETRTVHDPFLGKDVEVSNNLVDRLRGKYACGPMLPNGEPEFGWRQFETSPVQHEAAAEIERLRDEVEAWLVWSNQHRAWWRPNSAGYTRDIRAAGRYSRDEAISISGQARDGWGDPSKVPDELAIPLCALPEKIRAAVVRANSGAPA